MDWILFRSRILITSKIRRIYGEMRPTKWTTINSTFYLQLEDTEGFTTFTGNLFYFRARLKKEIYIKTLNEFFQWTLFKNNLVNNPEVHYFVNDPKSYLFCMYKYTSFNYIILVILLMTIAIYVIELCGVLILSFHCLNKWIYPRLTIYLFIIPIHLR